MCARHFNLKRKAPRDVESSAPDIYILIFSRGICLLMTRSNSAAHVFIKRSKAEKAADCSDTVL